MLKKFFVGALIVVSAFGIVSVSEAHHGNNYDCRDHYYNSENYCCGNYYARGNSRNYGDCCDNYGGYCCR